MKRLKRDRLYYELCKVSGITPRKKWGHISRKEMLELLLILQEKASCKATKK
jgi:hypothetical protein